MNDWEDFYDEEERDPYWDFDWDEFTSSDSKESTVDYWDVESIPDVVYNDLSIEDDFACDYDDSWFWTSASETQEMPEWEKEEAAEEKRLKDDGWIDRNEQNCHFVPGDSIRFVETVYSKGSKTKRELLGYRTNIVRITKETYSKNLQHRYYFEVLESSDTEPLSVGKKTFRLEETLAKGFNLIKQLDNKHERESAVAESKQLCDKAYDAYFEKKKKQSENIWLTEEQVNRQREAPEVVEMEDDDDYSQIREFSEDEQKWLDEEWHKDIVLDPDTVNRFGKWKPEDGWILLSDEPDSIVVDDIICYHEPNFHCGYPYGRFTGTTLAIAKVIKVGRKYYHLDLIDSYGSNFHTEMRIRRTFTKVHYWRAHRILWLNEYVRMCSLRKSMREQFNTFEDYLEYIRPVNNENVNENEERKENVEMEDIIEVEVDDVGESPDEEIEDAEEAEDTSVGLTIFDRQIREDERGYFKMSGGRNSSPKTISNFKLKAEAKILHGNEWYFVCTAINGSGQEYNNIMLSRGNFQGASSFKKALSYYSNLEYYGDNRDTTQIQGLLTEQYPPEKAGTDTNGIHWVDGKWAYVEGQNVIDKDGVTDDIVYLGARANDSDLIGILEQPDIDKCQLQAIADNFNGFNDGSVTYPIAGWIGQCFLKERLSDRVNKHNTILLCQGEPGSGKSETVTRIIQQIFSLNNSITNIADATKFTFAINGCQSNMVPCFYDEWKLSVMQKWQIRNMDSMLLSVYNQTSLPRGCTDQTVKKYKFSAPLVIAGEMTLDSPSIKHRIIEVFFNYQKRQGSTEHFKQLCSLPLASFGKGLLQHMLGLSDDSIHNAFDEQLAAVDTALEDRFQENAALARSGLWLIMDYFRTNDISMDEYNEGFDYIDNAIKETMNVARITNVDKVISDFSIMSNSPNCSGNWLTYKRHYDIKDGILYIRIADTYAVYQKYAKSNRTQAELISKHSFLQQLQSKNYYIGKATARIGGKPCNAIRLDLNAMPEYIDADFAA